MQGKKKPGAVVVTESAAQAALRRGPVPELEPDEERVMRMRLGATLPLSARLERIATATDAEIEILAYEVEAFLHAKEHQQRATHSCAPTLAGVCVGPNSVTCASLPTTSRVKEKILRALRKKT
jgi:hypothetical protein